MGVEKVVIPSVSKCFSRLQNERLKIVHISKSKSQYIFLVLNEVERKLIFGTLLFYFRTYHRRSKMGCQNLTFLTSFFLTTC